MNKNLVIAVLIFAVGGWYFYSKNHVSRGTVANGVYSDTKNGFSLTFPAGWKEVPEKYLSPENGYHFHIPGSSIPTSLVMAAPAPDKAAIILRQAGRSDVDYKTLALETLRAMRSAGMKVSGYREFKAEGASLTHINSESDMGNGAWMHLSYFPTGKHIFLLISICEENSRPELLGESENVANSVRKN